MSTQQVTATPSNLETANSWVEEIRLDHIQPSKANPRRRKDEQALAELSRHELDLVALSYFHQLGHDSQHRIFKFFGWEAAKAKAANGGYTDYPKLASAKLEKMTMAEIGKFLVVCALASNLYCPSYLSGAALGKDSDLAKEAGHYNINAKGILREVTEKLAKKAPKQNNQSKLRPSTRLKRKERDG